MFKNLLISVLDGKGIYVSKTPSFYALLRDFLRASKINVVFDVGAFNGTYCRALREKIGYEGRIVSFEPCAATFQELSLRMRLDHNWKGFRLGLSDTDTTATLNTFGRGEFNSVLKLRDTGVSAYGLDPKSTPETIKLQRLESIWEEATHGIDEPRCFLKLDTQGHDLAAAQGAGDFLRFIHGIQSELPAVEIYDGMKSMPQALQMYAELGFVPFGFYPVNVVKSFGSAFEFDVLLRRPAKE